MEDRMNSCWRVQSYGVGANEFSDGVFGILPVQFLAWSIRTNVLEA